MFIAFVGKEIRHILRDRRTMLILFGMPLIMMLLFHIFENIGAVTGILPLTGIPLPFISQGGSSIVSNLIGIGLLLSVSYQNSLEEEKHAVSPTVRKKIVLRKIK